MSDHSKAPGKGTEFSTHYERVDAESDARIEEYERMIAKHLEAQTAAVPALPELDVTEEDVAEANYSRFHRESSWEYRVSLACRERQLLSALAQLQSANSEIERLKGKMEALPERPKPDAAMKVPTSDEYTETRPCYRNDTANQHFDKLEEIICKLSVQLRSANERAEQLRLNTVSLDAFNEVLDALKVERERAATIGVGDPACNHPHMDGLSTYNGPGKFWFCRVCGRIQDHEGNTPDEIAARLEGANERAERGIQLIDKRIATLTEISSDDKFPIFNASCQIEIRALEDAKRLLDGAARLSALSQEGNTDPGAK